MYMDDIAMESINFNMNKIIYVTQKMVIKFKQIITNFITKIKRVKHYSIPKEISECIMSVVSKLDALYMGAASTLTDASQWDKSLLNDIFLSSPYRKLFILSKNITYPESSYIEVSTKQVVSLLTNTNNMLSAYEIDLLKLKNNIDIDNKFLIEDRVQFIQNVLTVKINALNKFFTFGRTTENNEVIPLGKAINAKVDLDSI